MKSKSPRLLLGTFLIVLLSFQIGYTQEVKFHTHGISPDRENLDEIFSEYDIINKDFKEDVTHLQSNESLDLKLSYKDREYDIDLYKNYLVDEDYISRAAKGNPNHNIAIPMDGYTSKGNRASLSIANEFIYGYFEDGNGDKIHIQPLRFFKKESSANEFIVFYEKNVLDTTAGVCGTEHETHLRHRMQHLEDEQEQPEDAQMPMVTCLEVELAIASDYLMFQKYGSVPDLENRNIGVINDVQTNYVGEFDDDLEFNIVEQFVSDCSSCDPWIPSTSAPALLNDFTSWGPSGFSATHDMGELWTDREFDGPTVGIAWVGSVCSGNRYHALQDFTSNTDLTRVLVAHEMGHNFNASHDPSGSSTIMAPSVNNTNQWSSQSKNEINSFVNTIDPPFGCLSVCPVVDPVIADFGYVENSICAGSTVQFYEKATGLINTYDWSFPGGSPSTSTAPYPSVSYSGSGSYDVTLTVTDAAGNSDTKTISNAILVGSGGNHIKAFEDFEDGSTGTWSASGGQSWEISSEEGVEYGDNTFKVNNFSSSGMVDLESPVIDLLGYEQPHININYAYTTRNGNSDSLVIYISTDGGNTFSHVGGVAENGSGNYATAPNMNTPFSPIDSSEWCHGPTNSCLSIPLTGAAHQQDVVVRIRNKSFGGNNLYINYIYVTSNCYQLFPPIADFMANVQHGCDDLTVEFQDLSQENPVEWQWSFPGGTPDNSNEQNPTVYYPSPGIYSVQLTAINPAGEDTESKIDFIYIEGTPDAFFTYQVSGREVTFTNESVNALDYTWDFGDGNTSTDENPVHTYNQDGSFDVQLTASNSCGADVYTTTIDIATPPVAVMEASVTEGCEPLEVVFDATMSENTTAYYWEFEGGDPATSVDAVPTVTYDTAGDFDVLFVASNSNGHDTILLDDHITVLPQPEADFIYTQLDLTVEFFNNSLDYESLLWDFGDGNTSTSENPVHAYNAAGSYDVQLIAMNSCGNDTLTETIDVQDALNATFISDQTSGCVSFDVNYDAGESTGATTYLWTFEGGTPATSTDSAPTITYNTEGNFDVSLIVSDGIDADTITFENYITAEAVPEGDFDHTIIGREVELTLNVGNYDNFIWDFGDGNTSTEENPTHEYSADGSYNIVLSLMNNCDTIEVSQQIEIATPPVADFAFGNSEGCIPLEVTFTNNSSENATTFAWTFEGGNPGTSTMENPTITYNTAGTYDVELIAISNGGRDTLTLADAITVLPDPDADFSFEVDTTTVDFTNNSAEALSYFWDFGDGNTSTEVNPTHTYGTEGSYTVTLMAINDCDTSTFVREIGTASLPHAEFTVTQDREGCVPFEVDFVDESMGTVEAYEWTFEGGTPSSSTEQNPTVVYNNTGTFNVSLKVTNSAGSNEIVREDFIEVDEKPEANLDVEVIDTLSVNFVGIVNGSANMIIWDFGDGNTSNQENVIYTYSSPGTYEVKFIVKNECGADTTFTEVVIGATSVEQEQLKQIRVFPNPASTHFTVDRLPLDADIKVVDQYGRFIHEEKVTASKMKINASSWSSGVYYLNVLHRNENRIYRVIIQD